LAEGVDAVREIGDLGLDLRTPMLEVGLSRLKLLDRALDVSDLAIAVVDSLGLLVELGDDEG
jgi:hypothetical protein